MLGRRADHHLAVALHDLVGEAVVVEAAVAVRHRLDRAAGHRAAQRDALELGHHRRDQAQRQRGAQEIGEGDARLGGAGPRLPIDLEHLVEVAEVDPLAREPAVAGQRNEVGHALLGQVSLAATGGPRPHLGRDPLHLVRVSSRDVAVDHGR
jgi:hypothetical protein